MKKSLESASTRLALWCDFFFLFVCFCVPARTHYNVLTADHEDNGKSRFSVENCDLKLDAGICVCGYL